MPRNSDGRLDCAWLTMRARGHGLAAVPVTLGAVALVALAGAVPRALGGGDWSDAGDPRVVRYEDFGARGDGKADDMAAIARAHTFANQQGLPVRANPAATYYIGGRDVTAVIQTDTDFGSARFIVDDTNVDNRGTHVFAVRSALDPVQPEGITTLKSGQRKLTAILPRTSVVCVTDANIRRYIRRGANQNEGAPQTDIFLVNTNGEVDADTPILWDFEQITRVVAYPVDPVPLRITGGRFTTIANAAESKSPYYARGIAVRRSNVVIEGLEHRITGEGDQGAPYGGFINVGDCAHVTVRDTTLTGHKTYETIGSAGRPVSMGSYDIMVARAVHVSFVDCRQFDDIKDRARWGIMASNHSKNLLYERCTLSRFDAHQGVAGATIRDSVLGHAGLNAIGSGVLRVENTTAYGRSFISLRGDYGSTWQGEFIVRNCTFVPACGEPVRAVLINGSNDGQHDFGYTCHMPARIDIDGLHIDDSRHPDGYNGPAIFADFNPSFTNAACTEAYPYVKTREVLLRNVSTASGKPLRISDNAFMFKDVTVTHR